MRNVLRHTALLLALVAAFPVGAETGAAADQLTQQMTAFVATLDAGQRSDALYAFDDDERFDLRLAPLGLEGLRVDRMSDAQWQQLESALGTVLSDTGRDKMNTIRSLEYEVREMEGGFFGLVMGWMRDPRRYFLALFGEPEAEASWGMRFDGHHLSLNWTSVPGEPLSVTPLFLGGQPRAVPEGFDRAGLRVLAGEEDRALVLINGMTDAERSASRIAFGPGGAFSRPMSVVEGESVERLQPVGFATGSLGDGSQARLFELIDVVLDNFVAEVAESYRARITAQRDTIHFAYAVPDPFAVPPLSAGSPMYYRIQGADFVIEYDNTSDEAQHVHLVWREFDGDFGRDLLGEHLAREH